MNTSIIFSHTATGHVMEYFHHIYDMCKDCKDRCFVFVVPKDFESIMCNRHWEANDNILFDFLAEAETSAYNGAPVLKTSKELTKILNQKIRKYKADKVLSLFWFPLVPYGAFEFPKSVRISAIFYDVYLREVDTLSWKAKLRNIINFELLSKARVFDTCFILNDANCAEALNAKFHSAKFKYLPDPFNMIEDGEELDFRKENDIDEEKVVFAHFGGLTERKGTMTIVDSISRLTEDEKQKYVFVFAGRIYNDIREEFYRLLDRISGTRVIVKDEFCSDGYLKSLCESCNAILMPYKSTNRSSGILGYASQFQKPVIGPNNGLISDIIKSYGLGCRIDVNNLSELTKTYRDVAEGYVPNPSTDYCERNSIDSFCAAIRGSII